MLLIQSMNSSSLLFNIFHNMLSYSPIFAKMWLKPVLDWRTIGIQYPPQSHRFSNQVACLASAAHASRLWYCPAKAIYLTMMYFTVILQWFYGTSWWFYGTWWWFYSCFMVLYDDFTVNLWWFDGLDQQKIKEHAGLYGDILMPSDPESGFCHIFGCFQMTVVWSSLMGIAIGYCIIPTIWSGCLRKRGVHPQLTAILMGKMMID